MIFKAYRRQDGAVVLVPECMLASKEAESRHGPLAYAGLVDSSCVADPAAWRRVLADIDRQSYAVVRSSLTPLVNDGARPVETA
jgi:hypothetical protein